MKYGRNWKYSRRRKSTSKTTKELPKTDALLGAVTAADIIESMGDGLVIIDLDGNVLSMNPAMEKILAKCGVKEKDVIGKPFRTVENINLKDIERLGELIKETVQSGSAGPIKIGSPDRGYVFSLTASLLKTKMGRPSFVITVIRDLTDVKHLESQMRETEDRYKRLFEHANDAILIANSETGLLIDANKAAEELLGRPKEEIIGMHQSELHPPDKAEYYKQHFKQHVMRGNALDLDSEIITKSGRIVPVSISASVTKLNGKRVIQGIFRDMTGLRREKQKN